MIFSTFFDGHKINIATQFRDTKDTDLILLLHGLGCSKKSFCEIWTQSYLNEYAILAIDFVGFGESSKPRSFSYSLEDQAQIIGDLINKISFKSLHIVAHSMGGAIGLLLPENNLNKVNSFLNIEGNLTGYDCGVISRKIISSTYKLFEKKYFHELKLLFNKFETDCTSIDNTEPYAMYYSAKSLVKWSDSNILLDKFHSMSCRKAYFVGENNINMRTVNHIKKNIAIIPIEKSGHFIMNDNPKKFYSKMYQFITNKIV